MGALAQVEMAECLPGWEWVSLFLADAWPRKGEDTFLANAKVQTERNDTLSCCAIEPEFS